MATNYENKAINDYRALLGKTVLLSRVSGYKGTDSEEVQLKSPKEFKICETNIDDVLHYNDSWIDPYYNVEPLGDYPELQEMRSFWCFGKGYNTETGEVSSGDVD